MRGPIAALLGTRVVGTYIRLRIAFALGGLLALGAAALLLGVGGVPGLLALFSVTALVLVVLGAVFAFR